MRKLFAQSGVLLLALATSLLLDRVPMALADGTSETPLATGTIDQNLLNPGSNFLDTQWISFCGYHQCGDQGGGIFHRNDGCNVDGFFCIADSAGHHFARNEAIASGVYDGHKAGLWLDGTHTDNVATVNAVMAAAQAHGASTVALCGKWLAGADAPFTPPAHMTVDFCGQPAGALSNSNLDFRLSSLGVGTVAWPSAYSIIPGDGAALINATIECGTGTYAPANFKPVTTRDKVNMQNNFCANTAILINNQQVKLRNLQILGFTNAIVTSKGGKQPIWSHIYYDTNGGGIWIDQSSDVTQIDNVSKISYLTRGGAELWQLDGVTTSGGHYVAVIGVSPSDLQLLNGDKLYVGTALGGGAQSLGGPHVASCSGGGGACAVTHNGDPDGCLHTDCEEVLFPDTSSSASTFTASWSAGAQSTGYPQPLIVSSGDLSNIAVGQTLSTALTCVVNGVTVNAFQAGTTVKDKWAYTNEIVPSLPPNCAETSQSVTATDVAFTHDGRGVEINPAQRSGIGFKITNSGGVTTYNLHLYATDTLMECGTGCHQNRNSFLSLGDSDPLNDETNIGFLCDGDHTGDDCDDFTISGGVLCQHITVCLVVDGDGTHVSKVDDVTIGPGSGKTNGVGVDVHSGPLVLSNSGAGTVGSIFVADGQTFRFVYGDYKQNAGTGYTAGNVVTASGGTCTTAAQFTIDTVDVSGVALTGHQTVQGVCSVWPSNPIATTGGTGTGFKLNTDGLIPASLNMTGSNVSRMDVYVQTPSGTAFMGANNVCVIPLTCNFQHGQTFKHLSIGDYGVTSATSDASTQIAGLLAAATANNISDVYQDGVPLHFTGGIDLPAGIHWHCGGPLSEPTGATDYTTLLGSLFLDPGLPSSPTGNTLTTEDGATFDDGCHVTNPNVDASTNTIRSMLTARGNFNGTALTVSGRNSGIRNSTIEGYALGIQISSTAAPQVQNMYIHATAGMNWDTAHSGPHFDNVRLVNLLFLNRSNNEVSYVATAVASGTAGVCRYTVPTNLIAEGDTIYPTGSGDGCSNFPNGATAHVVDSTHVEATGSVYAGPAGITATFESSKKVAVLSSLTNVAAGQTIVCGVKINTTIAAVEYGGGNMVKLTAAATGTGAGDACTIGNPHSSNPTIYLNAGLLSGDGFHGKNSQGGVCIFCTSYAHAVGYHADTGMSNFRFIANSNDGYKELNTNTIGVWFADTAKNNWFDGTLSAVGMAVLSTTSASVPNHVNVECGLVEEAAATGCFDVQAGALNLDNSNGILSGTSWIGDSAITIQPTGAKLSGQDIMLQLAADQSKWLCSTTDVIIGNGSSARCGALTGSVVVGGLSIAADICQTTNLPLVGSKATSVASVDINPDPGNGFSQRVLTKTDSVDIKICNTTGGALTPPSATANVVIVQP